MVFFSVNQVRSCPAGMSKGKKTVTSLKDASGDIEQMKNRGEIIDFEHLVLRQEAGVFWSTLYDLFFFTVFTEVFISNFFRCQ